MTLPKEVYDRLIAEEIQLGERIGKLHTKLFHDPYSQLDDADRYLLLKQLETMKAYQDVLKARIRRADGLKCYTAKLRVEARPMNRGAYNQFRGWTIPANEDPTDEGYLVRDVDTGHVNWIPKAAFEARYKEYQYDPYQPS